MIVEVYLVAATIFLAGGGAVCCLGLRRSRGAQGLSLAAFGILAAAVIFRAIRIGHAPIFGTFEAGTGGALAAIGLAAVWLSRRDLPLTAPGFLLIFAAAILGFGLAFNTHRIPLTISELSLWTDFHAFAAYLALALFAGSAALALPQLWGGPFPELDRLTYRFAALGFVLLSLMLASGAYYASILFGRFWAWDPVETLALLSWLGYGIIIHMRLFFGYRDRKFAVLALIAFALLVVSFKLVPLLPDALTFHHFDLKF